jgi:hypothetical protein
MDARIRDRRADDVIDDVLERVPVPVEFSEPTRGA